MGYYVVFGSLALGIWGLLYVVLGARTPWNPYVDWLVAWSVAGFILYGLDKRLARAKGPRVPELVLNFLAALGGFAGCWLGMAAFRHKSNIRRHPLIWVILLLSTASHAVFIYLTLLSP
jgi:uncharacterized membrane protein YsdA (DUF1294 family)